MAEKQKKAGSKIIGIGIACSGCYYNVGNQINFGNKKALAILQGLFC
ncbi:MAG: hypothetical protein ACRYGB_15835 [Janthinobacterium lividum]